MKRVELGWFLSWCGFKPWWGIFFFYFSKKFFCNLVSMYNLFRKFSKCKYASFYKKKLQNVQNPGIIPPKFSWSFDHSFNEPWPTKKKFFLTRKKKFFWPQFLFFLFFFFLSKSHRNYGDIMPGFGTWSKSIISMVKTFAV